MTADAGNHRLVGTRRTATTSMTTAVLRSPCGCRGCHRPWPPLTTVVRAEPLWTRRPVSAASTHSGTEWSICAGAFSPSQAACHGADSAGRIVSSGESTAGPVGEGVQGPR
jgi:hypothetical protein